MSHRVTSRKYLESVRFRFFRDIWRFVSCSDNQEESLFCNLFADIILVVKGIIMTSQSRQNDTPQRPGKGHIAILGFSKAELTFWGLYLLAFAAFGFWLEDSGLRQTAIWICITATVIFVIWTFVVFRIIRKKERRFKVLANISLGIVGLIAICVAFIYTVAPSMMFHPHFDEVSYSVLLEKREAEEISFETAEGVISGWFWHNAREDAPTLIYFGGNAENASTRFLRILKDDRLMDIFKGYQVVFLDYPGYGLTSGEPSEESLKEFGLAAYDAIAAREDVEDIVIMGYSIGSGVANYVASERAIKGLILMAPYADGYDLYNSFMNIFHGPMRMLVAFKMEAIQFASSIEVKPLIFASNADEIIPFASSIRLSEAYPDGCETLWFNDIGHSDFWGNPQMHSTLQEYLKALI